MKKFLISGCSMLMLTSMAHSNSESLSDKEIDLIMEQAAFSGLLDTKQASTKAGSNFVTVGSNSNCDYRIGNTKIQDAIDDDNTEIRIAHGTYEENLFINSKNVKLLGGYTDCTAANNDDYSVTSTFTKIIPATGSGLPVIRVTGDSARHNLTLRNLSIENGESTSTNYSGGGVAFYNADYGVNIQKANIQNNNGKWGGGVGIRGGKTNISLIGSIILGNDAEVGGGLYCLGSNSSLVMDNSSYFMFGFYEPMIVAGNNAVTNGGGAYITQGCQLTSYVGGSLLDGGGFYVNKADRHGGGIYASGGANISLIGERRCSNVGPITFCSGNNTQPNTFYDNTADNNVDNDGNGGAVYATGNSTKVTATNVNFITNQAFKGGAVYVTNGAEFDTYAVNHQNCWKNGRCNQFTSNRASTDNGHGGAFYASDGGKISVLASHIERNRADFGSGFYIKGLDSNLQLEGSYVVDNGEPGSTNYENLYPVRVTTNANAVVHYSTIADNNVPITNASVANSSGSLELLANIIHDTSGAVALKSVSPVSTTQECNIVNSFGDMFSAITNIEDNPRFVDRVNNDYHIDAAFSPAVDYCLGNQGHVNNKDTDGDTRAWDDYTVSNIYGPFDAGADETYQNDVIFEDDFQ